MSAAAAVLAWGAYAASVRSAVAYGELLRASFDLYRRDLLKAMGL
ncbi:hypothetical protein [Amycolatopsis sp. NPDC049868]